MPLPAASALARPPASFGVRVGVGAAAMTAATVLAAYCAGDPTSRMLIVAVAIGGYAATVADTRAGLATTLIGFGLYNGFLVNGYGKLSFDGTTILWNLFVFTVALGLGLGQRWLRHVRDSQPDPHLGSQARCDGGPAAAAHSPTTSPTETPLGPLR
jgi:hypothetical protein